MTGINTTCSALPLCPPPPLITSHPPSRKIFLNFFKENYFLGPFFGTGSQPRSAPEGDPEVNPEAGGGGRYASCGHAGELSCFRVVIYGLKPVFLQY